MQNYIPDPYENPLYFNGKVKPETDVNAVIFTIHITEKKSNAKKPQKKPNQK